MNRAFYGIMGSKMLMTADGTYTNAVYGFLAILFKIEEDLKPDYIAVAFDLKAPTARHKMYEGYKATRHGMPDELAMQMPIIKEILRDMNITIIEMEGYEADDVLGTLSKRGEKEGIEVTILSGDRDTFQLTSDHITVRIPRTKAGKTETEDFDRNKVLEVYGLEPKKLIEVKGLQGDTSDNIPGVPGVGEKTALSIVKEYGSIEKLYKELEEGRAPSIKGKTREKIIENKDLAFLSKELGTININVPIEETIESLAVKEWNNDAVLNKFKELKFNRYIERFDLKSDNNVETKPIKDLFEIKELNLESKEIEELINKINEEKQIIYYLEKETSKDSKNIINKQLKSISIIVENTVYYITIDKTELLVSKFKDILENEQIQKIGYKLKEDYVILKELGIDAQNMCFDVEIATYLLNPTASKYELTNLAVDYLQLDVNEYLKSLGVEKNENKQINLFDVATEQKEDSKKYEISFTTYVIKELKNVLTAKLEEQNGIKLFNEIEMPLATVLAKMQYEGMYIDRAGLIKFGEELKKGIEELTKQIYELAGEEFNINSTQQLGNILFEKLKLTSSKKTKKGYSTDVDALEKIKREHPIVEKILEYRSLMKLNSTYVEGMLPYINEKTNRIHSYFHQTVTATGRISSTEPNLQNIPTRIELGKTLRKVFKPKDGYVFIDADYSQIELRVLAHISKDKHMLEAFRNGEDIHKQAASKVLGIPLEEVTKEQRSAAKAVNFGIVYGISDFGLAEQLGTSRKEAKNYIEQYLEKYSGIDKFMKDIVEDAKEKGYVETLFNRRRYLPELKSNNYMVRQFGARAAMNTPIQGTAADIMKIAMVNLNKKLEETKLDAKIILQVHDELILEVKEEEKEQAKELLKNCMENAVKLTVPLEVEVSEANNWYDCK
jgi:DNA polymerase-1